MRAALGAGRERLVRQLITESVILTLLGGAAGVVGGGREPSRCSPASCRPRCRSPVSPALDLRVLALAALFTALTGLGFGLFPALRAVRRTGFAALREGNRAGGGRKQRVRAVLVTVEVTMSVILLITSGLLDPRRVARAGHRPRIRAPECAHAQDGVAAAEVRQPGASR